MSLPRKKTGKGFDKRETPLARTRFVRKKAEGKKRRNYTGLRSKPYRSLKTRLGVKDELDRVTSLLVRARDGCCVTCGTTEDLQCSHYFKRTFLATRWNLTNCNTQCGKHNELHNRVPWPYREYMVKLIGEDGLDDLFKLRNSVWRPTDEDLRALLDSHRALLRTMKKAA
jgi:hypothetical protein